MKRFKWKQAFALALVLGLSCPAARAIVVHVTDFIPDGTRTHFNGFDLIPATSAHAPTYTEGGIKVDQISGQGNDIWTTCFAANGCWAINSTKNWYPNGGDFGWTRITRADSGDFASVGLLLGSGFGGFSDQHLLYELRNDGIAVLSGYLSNYAKDSYLGFSGGGFDEINLRNASSGNALTFTFGDGVLNALAIDDIELAGAPVAEPGALALLALGLLGVGFVRCRVR
jgi:hypothetical protein